ncbi:hypothetical protein TUE45_00123 [Streptomyces reticuli]|nr:hypothetical protein TUE45_00123 [Streptomyces reticuli]
MAGPPRKWAADGTWDRLFIALITQADAEGDLDRIVAVDSTILRAHQHAAGARHEGPPAGEPADHALGRSRGELTTEIPPRCRQPPQAAHLPPHPGQTCDAPAFPDTVAQLRVPRPTGRPKSAPDVVPAAAWRRRCARACSIGAAASSGTMSGSGKARRQLPHRGGLPLHRLRDSWSHPGWPGGLPVCLDRPAVSLGQRPALPPGGRASPEGWVGGLRGGPGLWMWTARTFAPCTRSLAASISSGARQRSCVPYAGASGVTSRRPMSASNCTARTCPASSGAAAARMLLNCARTLPSAAGATMRRSVTGRGRRGALGDLAGELVAVQGPAVLFPAVGRGAARAPASSWFTTSTTEPSGPPAPVFPSGGGRPVARGPGRCTGRLRACSRRGARQPHRW